METETAKKTKKPKKPSAVFQLPDGTVIHYTKAKLDKFWRDIIRHHHGVRAFEKIELTIVPDAYDPVGSRILRPGNQSPLCIACGLDKTGCHNPYLNYVGPKNPVATILVESVSPKEDNAGMLGAGGTIARMQGIINKLRSRHGVSLDEIRWVPITRCAARNGDRPNYKTKGNWCRYHAVQDLMLYPPKVIIPVGTAVLGLLSHRSNAQDWSGRMLTWRGWPDDWLMDKENMLNRADPLVEGGVIIGHPLFGKTPDVRIPMVPVQNPNLVWMYANQALIDDWHDHLIYALSAGKRDVAVPDYSRPWYRVTTDPEEIKDTLLRVNDFAKASPGFIVAYDTETTGLKQWPYFKRQADETIRSDDPQKLGVLGTRPRIVFMMFRWVNPQTGQPESIGFPWDYPESEIMPHMEDISPYVLSVLMNASVTGHNLVFDELFTIAGVGRIEGEHVPFNPDGSWNENWLWLQERINSMADAATWDTWHMAFTALQRKGSLGLEILAYDYVSDLAGYEEEMTLLIGLHGDTMDPANNKGGHYANCPKELWKSHLEPYVMGDVEVTYKARNAIQARLEKTKPFKIPMANPTHQGYFRYYQCPNRAWVYKNIMTPANRTLIKMMARGMYIDPDELEEQEEHYPAAVEKSKQALRDVDPAIELWCTQKEQESLRKAQEKPNKQVPKWELDLENKTLLKELLFDHLQCPIQRFTKKGRQLYGEDPKKWETLPESERKLYAAVDKYTLNHLTVSHPNLRPLQQYRKVYKLYTTYVRPMRNMMSDLDKKERAKEPHLSTDHCIHTSFMLTGTRSGRLSSRDPNLQNIPLKGLIKRLFTSRFGPRGCIYTADLSQIELRLMACACGDESMVDAYLNDIDIHSLTASKIFKIPYETFTKKYMEDLQKHGQADKAKDLEIKRRLAKTTNFLTGYGGGAFGLQNLLANDEIYLPIEECEKIIESFFTAYPLLKRFLGVYKGFIEDHAVAVSMFGRVRQFDEIYGDDREARSKALRAGCNHLIQSTASDLMLICLFTIENLMRAADLKSILVSTVHDSLVIDAVRQELPQVHEIVNGVMNDIPSVLDVIMPDYDHSWIILPFASDSEIGVNYLETNKISGDNPDWDKLLAPQE